MDGTALGSVFAFISLSILTGLCVNSVFAYFMILKKDDEESERKKVHLCALFVSIFFILLIGWFAYMNFVNKSLSRWEVVASIVFGGYCFFWMHLLQMLQFFKTLLVQAVFLVLLAVAIYFKNDILWAVALTLLGVEMAIKVIAYIVIKKFFFNN